MWQECWVHAGRGPWEVDAVRAQGASRARLRSQGFSLWTAWPDGRAESRDSSGCPPPPDNWVDAVLVAVIEAYDMLAFMTVTPLRESPMCMGGTEEDSCGMI